MKNKNITKKLLITTLILLLLVPLSLWLLFESTIQSKKPNDDINEVTEVIDVVEEIIELEEEPLFTKEQYQEYKTINNDYIGQIIFESGIINEPVVYSSINSYYLRRNINKEYSIQGTIYLDDRNTLNNQNLIIYGHYTEPGFTNYKEYIEGVRPMFSNLDLLLDKENYEENKTIYLFLEDEVREYVVASVYYCPLYKDEEGKYTYVTDGYDFYYTNYSFDEFDTYSSTIKSNQRYNTDVKFNNYDKFLTLQTCVNGREDLREIVLCKEVGVDNYK